MLVQLAYLHILAATTGLDTDDMAENSLIR
jgi:hypothetical protein